MSPWTETVHGRCTRPNSQELHGYDRSERSKLILSWVRAGQGTVRPEPGAAYGDPHRDLYPYRVRTRQPSSLPAASTSSAHPTYGHERSPASARCRAEARPWHWTGAAHIRTAIFDCHRGGEASDSHPAELAVATVDGHDEPRLAVDAVATGMNSRRGDGLGSGVSEGLARYGEVPTALYCDFENLVLGARSAAPMPIGPMCASHVTCETTTST